MRTLRGGVKIKKTRITIITALLTAIIDQASKAAVIAALDLNRSIEVIPGLFNLVHFRNPGAAFSIFHSGGAARTAFLIATSVIALVVVAALLRQAKDHLTVFALSLVGGGAVGNLIDRVRLGEVVDFLYFHIGRYYWPAFNAADSAITVGVVLLFYAFYFRRT